MIRSPRRRGQAASIASEEPTVADLHVRRDYLRDFRVKVRHESGQVCSHDQGGMTGRDRGKNRTHVIPRNSPQDQMEQMVSRVLENRSERLYG
jgi:hypothetical protein